MPVESLDAARVRLTALGFSVAQDALHPFGTENACVYFADGTFLEPLAVAQREDCEATAREGNVFTARDQAYRFRNGQNGFSSLVFATTDAARDHKTFKRTGISAGRKLAFDRNFVDANGKAGTASFLLAFAADLRAPDVFFFTCERVKVPKADRKTLEKHPNGVTAMASVICSELNPTDFQYLLQDVMSNRDVNAHSFGLEIAASNGVVDVLTPEGLETHYGVARNSAERGLRLEGLVLRVASLEALRALFDGSAIEYRILHDRLVVDRAPGQGAFMAFSE